MSKTATEAHLRATISLLGAEGIAELADAITQIGTDRGQPAALWLALLSHAKKDAGLAAALSVAP